jgi:DNA processing protein
MNVSDTRLCLQLHSVPQLSDSLLARLFLHYGCPKAVVASNFEEWSILGASADVISEARATLGVCGKRNPIDVDAQLENLTRLGAQVLCLTDEAYPALLRTIYDPPPLLYVRGNLSLLQQAQIAVVGSRKASPAGLRAARTLSCQLVAAGLHICSGLAQGIDGEAHRAALGAGGGSIAVMATGIDIIYPIRHVELAERLANNGAVVTEYPPGCKPERYRFPRRNRILSGLSLGVLVVEAALRSGTLITAGAALEQGREVFALPWAMFHEGGRGCLRLIRDGAKMVGGVEDILDELGPLYAVQQDLLLGSSPADAETVKVPAGQRRVLALIGYEALTVDELVVQSSLPIARVMASLSALELEGHICRCAGGYIHS